VVELRLERAVEQLPRKCQDAYKDVGARVTPGHLHGCKWSKTSGTSFPAITEQIFQQLPLLEASNKQKGIIPLQAHPLNGVTCIIVIRS